MPENIEKTQNLNENTKIEKAPHVRLNQSAKHYVLSQLIQCRNIDIILNGPYIKILIKIENYILYRNKV